MAALDLLSQGRFIFGVGVGYTMTEDMPEYITQLGLIDRVGIENYLQKQIIS